MRYFILNLFCSIIAVSRVFAFASTHDNQYRFGSDDTPGVATLSNNISRFKCDLSWPVDPSGDGLLSSEEVFSGTDAFEAMVNRHQPLVCISSICYDDLGDFDEECSGNRGAGEISKHLKERYGEGGIAVIIDEKGVSLQSIGDTLYALPAVYEKGYPDVWLDLDVVGGHSSTPTPNTVIGIISKIVTALESNPLEP
ncbi:hypothetical protein F5B21DRAFT_524691 [Xylaria acuta]|nr:hypothetical protein F5B21DRAFT_524691 [Xylaria acuta]